MIRTRCSSSTTSTPGFAQDAPTGGSASWLFSCGGSLSLLCGCRMSQAFFLAQLLQAIQAVRGGFHFVAVFGEELLVDVAQLRIALGNQQGRIHDKTPLFALRKCLCKITRPPGNRQSGQERQEL